MMSMLVILPFAFIRFAYEPWIEAQNESRTPRRLSSDICNHVIITNFDAPSPSADGTIVKMSFIF